MTRRGALGDFAKSVAIALFVTFMVVMPLAVLALIGEAADWDFGKGALDAAILIFAATGLIALILYRWRHPASAAERAASWAAIRRPRTWGWIVLFAALGLLASEGLLALASQAGLTPEPTNQDVIDQAFWANPLLMALFVVVLAPAYEELLFRRVLFGRLWAGGRPWLGLVLSSVFFALMHEMPGLDPATWPGTALLLLIYAVMGGCFAAVYWRTGTLWAPIAAHALNNGVALLALRLSA